MAEERVILDYATPISTPPPMGLLMASRACSILASIVGLMLLLLYAITGLITLAMFGFFWIYVGGAITFIGFVLATIYGAMSWSRGFPAPATRSKARSTIVFSLTPIPVALFCFFAGLGLIRLWDGLK